jgi:hypothetical protein
MFVLAMAALLSSLVPSFSPWWPDLVAHAWWALSMVAVITLIVVGERMTRCPRYGSKTSPDAWKCTNCGVSFEEPMRPPA